MSYTVRTEWDDEAGVWFVAESDVPGLTAEAPSIGALHQKLGVLIPELLELNGHVAADSTPGGS